MIVDCGDCSVRGDACSDCVVSVLLGVPAVPSAPDDAPANGLAHARRLRLEQDEQEAMRVLADGGLIPRLRLVRGGGTAPVGRTGGGSGHGPEHAAG
ncbi:hypothetical protein [Rhodococcoides corynebacterioides]|uniref:hypothetical protein n=1 Tax=Rhodococcoides corynebacterioides TaxID=53972 RepID=UPI001C9A6552|nr:hypothetical protein [Rhodococcus corynebacterioides]MBY6351118.1 hypothetical protein [Rhodococcus corynebacterioides]MBY6362404.1 hypothetical protein [Rhodococcus corynebacterioides]